MIFFMFVSSIKICLCPADLTVPADDLQRKHHYVVKIFTDFIASYFHFCGSAATPSKIA